MEPKKNALIRIWQILLHHSDFDHPLLQDDIVRYLDEEYDIQLERKAVVKISHIYAMRALMLARSRERAFISQAEILRIPS